MPPNGSFESQSFNLFSVNEDLKDNDQDPDVNFYQIEIQAKIIFSPTSKHWKYQQKRCIICVT